MADVTIHIRALDLTGPAVRSAKENLRRLTTQSRVDEASRNVGDAFKNLVRGVETYARQSATVLALDVQRRRRAIQTIEAMETRLRLSIMKEVSATERHRQRERLRTLSSYKQHVNQELSALKSAIRQKDQLEATSERNRVRRMRETAREDERLRRQMATAARNYNRQIEADEKRVADKRKALASGMKNFRGGVFGAGKRLGFESLFAGVSMGSQAGMLGSSLGGALGGLGSELASGITSLTNIVPKTIAIVTKAVSVAVRGIGTVASLGVSALTTVYGVALVVLPKIGILLTGVITGVGSMIAGVMRGATDIAAGAVELIGGALEGIVQTAQAIVGSVMGALGGILKGIVGTVSSAVEKVLGVLGDAFGGLLNVATSTFESMLSKNIEFGKNMADVFTQIPEYGKAGFKELEDSVNDLFRRLPLGRTDLTKGLFEIVSTKLTKTPGEATQVLQGVAKAAVAGGSEASVFDTAKAATAVLSAFRLEAKDTEATLSKMFKASAEGRFSFADLAEGIQNVAGIAANFGESLDDLLASFVLASQSMAKQTTPVGVKNLILSLAAPTAEAEKQINRLGLSFKEYTNEELDSIQAGKQLISQLEAQIGAFEKMEKKTHAQKLALTQMKRALKAANEEMTDLQRGSGKFIGVIPSVKKIAALDLSPAQERGIVPERRALAALQAIKSELDKADETLGEIAADTGQQMATAFDIQMDTMDRRIKLLYNTFEDLFTEPFKYLEPTFKRALDKMIARLPKLRDAIGGAMTFDKDKAIALVQEWLDKAIDSAFDAGEWIAKNWGDVAKQVAEAWGQVEIVLKAIYEVVKAGGTVLKDVFGIDSAEAFATAMKKAGDAANDLWKAIETLSTGDMEPIIGLIESIRIAWAELTDFMMSSFARALAALQGPLNQVVDMVQDAYLGATNPLDTAGASEKPSTYARTYRNTKASIKSFIGEGGEGLAGGMGKAIGRPLSSDELDKIASGLINRIERSKGGQFGGGDPQTGRLGTTKANTPEVKVALRDLVQEATGIEVLYSKMEDSLEDLNDPLDMLARQLGNLKTTIVWLDRFGFNSTTKREGAFKPNTSLADAATSMMSPSAPGVRAEIEIERTKREEERMIRALSQVLGTMTKLLIMDPTGASLAKPTGTGLIAKKPRKTDYDEGNEEDVQFTRPGMTAAAKAREAKNSENIEETAENTEEMADSLSHFSTAPSVSDDQALLTGKLASGKGKSGGFAAAAAAIATAQGVAGETIPEKIKKQKFKSDRFLEEDEARFDKQDLVRARKAWHRKQMEKAFSPFGEPMGIRKGPLGQTPGKPIVDPETGELRGFTKPNFGLGAVRVKKPMSTSDRKKAYTAYKAQKLVDAAQRKSAKNAKAAAFKAKYTAKPKATKSKASKKPEKMAWQTIPFLNKLFGAPEEKKADWREGIPHDDRVFDRSLKMTTGGLEQEKLRQTAGLPNTYEESASRADELNQTIDEANKATAAKAEEEAKLYAAMEALAQIQKDAADGVITLTVSQVAALTQVTAVVGNALQAIVEHGAQQTDIMAKFMENINQRLAELAGQKTKLEASAGI